MLISAFWNFDNTGTAAEADAGWRLSSVCMQLTLQVCGDIDGSVYVCVCGKCVFVCGMCVDARNFSW